MKHILLIIASAVTLFACSESKKIARIENDRSLYEHIGKDYIEDHPCYTIPETTYVKADTVKSTVMALDTIVTVDTVHHTTVKQVVKVKNNYFTVHDSVIVNRPDLRYQKILQDSVSHLSLKLALSSGKLELAEAKKGTWMTATGVISALILIALAFAIIRKIPKI